MNSILGAIDEPVTRRPIVTISIMVLAVLAHLSADAQPNTSDFQMQWALFPVYVDLAGLLGHMWMHGSYSHLIGNMAFFFISARKVEDVLGHWKFLVFYLAAGVASAAFHILSERNLPIPMMGASGAVSGVMGALLFLYPRMQILPVPILRWFPVWFLFGFWFLDQLAAGIFANPTGIQQGVAFSAHIGGFVYGALTMAGFFGWNQGLGAEIRGRARRYYTPKSRQISKRRHAGLAMAWGLQASALIFLIVAFLDNGFSSPRRPATYEEATSRLAKKIAVSQDSDTLFREAVKRGRGADPNDRILVGDFRHELDDRISIMIDMHEQLAEGISPPPGMIADWERFQTEELPKIPPESRISLDAVNAINVIYKPGLNYQILCGTNMTTKQTLKAYLDRMDDLDWAVESPIYDIKRDAAKVHSFSGKWALTVVIVPDRGASGYKTIVIWHLRKF